MITVRELIEVGGFTKASVLAGEDFLDKELLGVTSFDSPDGHRWLRAGEFVLTTGFPFLIRQNTCEATLIQLIDELAAIGTPGLAIKLGRYMASVPAAVLAHAAKRQMPILSFPMDKAWSDVIVPVTQYINDKQRLELNRTHAIYERFHLHLTANDPVSKLAALLADLLQTPISIEVPSLRWKWAASPDAPPGGFGFATDEGHDIPLGQAASPSMLKNPLVKRADGRHVRWLLQERNVQGAICTGIIERDLYAWEKVAIEQSAALLSLEIERQRSVNETYQRFRNDFLQLLLSDQMHARDVLTRKADEVGWKLADHYTVAVLGVSPLERTGIENWNDNRDLLLALTPSLSALDDAILLGLDQQNRIVLLIPTASGSSDSTACLTSTKQVLAALLAFSWQQRVFVGLGRFHAGHTGIAASYREAQISFRAAMRGLDAKAAANTIIVAFHDLGLERILFAEQPDREARLLAQEYLDKINEYDREKNGQLLDTLHVFLQVDGNHAEAASRLYVHKNTIKYRLALIRELTGLNPDHGHDLLLLRIAMTVQSIGFAKG
ncbi:PucR family transcriptional regulator [Brevibacillus parabrevis]|uniref:PucR family transcriptional regulator n=1 Tax=Brevibacillus parabrevis TaxID=54914 RepID=UPI0023805858|nr:PucR family transcriptional regulator [Brevibacillus parabrevis]WDV97791.1 PucR family transcriptional regulator ligand-binding domain-containing protein [Brevibacillus parabrevis]